VKRFVAIALLSGLLLSGCVGRTVKPVPPPRPILEGSVIQEDGSLLLSPTDKDRLMLYIHTLETQLLVALGAVVAAVVKLTPTKKDDEFVEKAKPFWVGFLDALRKLIGKK
jgi:hypothetical protein